MVHEDSRDLLLWWDVGVQSTESGQYIESSVAAVGVGRPDMRVRLRVGDTGGGDGGGGGCRGR